MGLIRSFPGFPAETLSFLADLAANNRREWFEAHRDIYQQKLIEPAQAFVEALGMRLTQSLPSLDFDPAINGSGSLIRIYRDVRFSKDKSPYKTWFGMRFWESTTGRKQGPGLFVVLEPSGVGLHSGIWKFQPAQLRQWRLDLDDSDRGAAFDAVVEAVQSDGHHVLRGEHYRRLPRGFAADHPRAEWLRHNGLFTSLDQPFPPDSATDPALVDRIAEAFLPCVSLHQWLTVLASRALSA